MRKQIYSLLLCFVAISLFNSCVSKKKFNELLNDKTAIDEILGQKELENTRLIDAVADLEEAKATLKTEFDSETKEKERLAGELETSQTELEASQDTLLKLQEVATANAEKLKTMEESVNSTFETYAKSGLNILQKNNMLYVDPTAPIRYASGSTRVDEEAKQALASMAEVLKTNPEIRILVEGHTDNVPLIEGARFKDNVALSYARANRVVKELVSMGVNPNQLSAVGRGEQMPIVMDENDSEDAKSMNRRTEFIVLANVGGLYNMTQSL